MGLRLIDSVKALVGLSKKEKALYYETSRMIVTALVSGVSDFTGQWQQCLATGRALPTKGRIRMTLRCNNLAVK